MFQFSLLLLVSAVILQPIGLILSIIGRFTWHPPKLHESFNCITSLTPIFMRADCLASLDHKRLTENGDSAKFIGLYYAAVYNKADYAEQAWSYVKALFDVENRTFRRTATHPEYPTFSGDMLSGMLLAIATRLRVLTVQEKEDLTAIWKRCSFEGWPMLIPHPIEGKSFERGFIWTPWRIYSSGSLLTLLIWLKLGAKVTGKWYYTLFYWLAYILHAPMLWLGTGDGQVFIGNVYATAYHSTHSHAVVAYTGHKLGVWVAKWQLYEMYKRWGEWNADVLAMWPDRTAEDQFRLWQLITHTYNKPAYGAVPADKKYLSVIWPPEFVMRAKSFYPPSIVGADYTAERSPLKSGGVGDPKGWCVDVIFPACFYDRV